jgi:hypothetical protein
MYPLKFHKTLSPEKWFGYSRSQQLLMIANELNRAGIWLEKGHFEDVDRCYERAFELTDFTVEDRKWSNSLKELLRFREMLGDLYINKNKALNKLVQSALIALSSESFNLLHG